MDALLAAWQRAMVAKKNERDTFRPAIGLGALLGVGLSGGPRLTCQGLAHPRRKGGGALDASTWAGALGMPQLHPFLQPTCCRAQEQSQERLQLLP